MDRVLVICLVGFALSGTTVLILLCVLLKNLHDRLRHVETLAYTLTHVLDRLTADSPSSGGAYDGT